MIIIVSAWTRQVVFAQKILLFSRTFNENGLYATEKRKNKKVE